MTYDEFNNFCRSLQATTYVVQWGGSHVWKVGGKVFAIGGWGKLDKPAFTFKTSDLHFNLLQDEEGFRAAPYMASRGMKWIQQYETFQDNEINNTNNIKSDESLRYYIKESYRLVSLGLTKKLQKELGLNQS